MLIVQFINFTQLQTLRIVVVSMLPNCQNYFNGDVLSSFD